MNFTTLDGSIYILELKPPHERVEFQFMPPSFEWSRSGNWVNMPVVGRNNDRKHLTGGEDKLSFTLDFSGLFEDDKQHAMNQMAWLQSLTMNNGYAGSYRKVQVIWGDTDVFRNKKWIVKSVRTVASEFNSNFGYLPTRTAIDINFELDPDRNTVLSDVRSQGSPFRFNKYSNNSSSGVIV